MTWLSCTIRHVDNDGVTREQTYDLSSYCRQTESTLADGTSRVQLDFITSTGRQIDPAIASTQAAKLEINRVQAELESNP
jgi:K+-transporting ATPase c subunit